MGHSASHLISDASVDTKPHQAAIGSIQGINQQEHEAERVTREEDIEAVKRIPGDNFGAVEVLNRDSIENSLKLQRVQLENIELIASLARVELESMVTIERLKREKAKAEEIDIVQITGMLCLAGIAALTLDYFVHGFQPIIKMRVMWFLKRSRPLYVDRIKHLPNDSKRSDFISHVKTMTCPTVLVGPSGSGKTTMLKSALKEYSNCGLGKVAFISIRSSECNKLTNSCLGLPQPKSKGNYRGVYLDAFNDMTKAILRSINYPWRPPYLTIQMRYEDEERVDLNDLNIRRLQEGLKMLIECASEIGQSSGKPPLLVFDEVHDLVKLDRLKNIGGESTFKLLAKQAYLYGVKSKHVRFLFASSSSELSFCFDKTVLKGKNRIDKYIDDYPQDEVIEHTFKEYGIPRDCTKLFTDRLGTRFRVLTHLIVAKDSRLLMDSLIPNIMESQRGALGAIMANSLVAPYFEAISNGEKVSFVDLPSDVVRMKSFSQAFYCRKHEVVFQNDAVGTIWREYYQDPYRKSLVKRQDLS